MNFKILHICSNYLVTYRDIKTFEYFDLKRLSRLEVAKSVQDYLNGVTHFFDQKLLPFLRINTPFISELVVFNKSKKMNMLSLYLDA